MLYCRLDSDCRRCNMPVSTWPFPAMIQPNEVAHCKEIVVMDVNQVFQSYDSSEGCAGYQPGLS